ncbi:HD domain-containing protein [Shouchella patagoniensis]|uniref:HD domain-containing protein n=1 Tax=Shouchella patagoniensis TaxID=228576 RepID=UPI000994B702|nr:HD domain-containing protein [Shouchella patagoniensis]
MNITKRTEAWVKEQLASEATGHDWYHIERVRRAARAMAEQEQADMFIVEMAALMHDLADDKIVESEEVGLRMIKDWLLTNEVNEEQMKHIVEIIQSISFSKGQSLHTLEAEIVQDADRLDALGAIGIARTFQYAGSKGHAMYDPSLPVRENMTKEEYRNGKTSAVHHFYEKLLKLKERMNTEAGKRMAEERHLFMEQFLNQFYKEWN